MTLAPTVTLNDGTEIPQLGLGTWQLRGAEAERVVREAIAAGYRHIDTASIYKNEEAVGKAIKDAIAAGDVTRDELFVTTKLFDDDQGATRAPEAFQESLGRLGLDFVDLYLIHWPNPKRGKYVETFEAIAKIQGLGSIQSIGVSNFYPEVLRELIERVGITPAVNQVELHPGFSQAALREYHRAHGITTEAWSPLGRGILLENPTVEAIAEQVGRTPAQVVLRWGTQLGAVSIPKTSSRERLAENLACFDFDLDERQMAALTALDGEPGFGRIFDDPRTR